MIVYCKLIAVIICCAVCCNAGLSTVVVNHSGSPIQLFWIDSMNNGSLRDQSGGIMLNGSQTHFHSQESHRFVVMLSPPVTGTEVMLTKGAREETFTIVFDRIAGKLEAKRTTKLDPFINEAVSAARRCSGLADRDHYDCIDSNIPEAAHSLATKDSLGVQNKAMAKRLREYMCSDTTMVGSKPFGSLSRLLVGKNVTIDMLLDTNNAKIWTVNDFITRDECATLYNTVNGRFETATVYATNGSAVVNSVRKATIAGYPMTGKTADPLWPLYNRILAAVNLITGMKLAPEGQEGLAVIHYDPTEQYLSHCDTKCEGQPFLTRGRVATAVMYCRVPEVGGATTFTKADIFVRPQAGMATFFSYKGADGRMDDGFTEHSGCPVIAGEKMIATAWLREGVDESDTHKRYDVVGRLISENKV